MLTIPFLHTSSMYVRKQSHHLQQSLFYLYQGLQRHLHLYFSYYQPLAYYLDTPARLMALFTATVIGAMMNASLLLMDLILQLSTLSNQHAHLSDDLSQWIRQQQFFIRQASLRYAQWPGPTTSWLRSLVIELTYRDYYHNLDLRLLSKSINSDEQRAIYDFLSATLTLDLVKKAYASGHDGVVIHKKAIQDPSRVFNFLEAFSPNLPRKITISFRPMPKVYYPSPLNPSSIFQPSIALHVFPKSKIPGGTKKTPSHHKSISGSFKRCEFSLCIDDNQPDQFEEYAFLTEDHQLSIEKSAGRSLGQIFSYIREAHHYNQLLSQDPSRTDLNAPVSHLADLPSFHAPLTVLDLLDQIASQLQNMHDATQIAHLDVKHGNITCSLSKDMPTRFTLIDYPSTIFTDSHGFYHRNHSSNGVLFSPDVNCMQPQHYLLQDKSPALNLNPHSFNIFSWNDLSPYLSAEKINKLTFKSKIFSSTKYYGKGISFLDASLHHDLWSLLYIGLCFSRTLDNHNNATVFIEEITDIMYRMLETYPYNGNTFISDDDRRAALRKYDCQWEVDRTIKHLKENIQDRCQALNPNALPETFTA